MNQKIQVRLDNETATLLEKLKKELNISKSDIVRMSIANFNSYVEKVNR